jgi:hypothetical protein
MSQAAPEGACSAVSGRGRSERKRGNCARQPAAHPLMVNAKPDLREPSSNVP